MIVITSIILLIILSITLLLLYNNKKIYLETKYKEEYYNNQYQEFEKIRHEFEAQFESHRQDMLRKHEWWMSERKQERDQIERSLVERKQAVEEIINQLECRRREAEKLRDAAVADNKEKINLEVAGYKKLKFEQANNELEKEILNKRTITLKEFNEFVELIEKQKTECKEELQSIIDQLDDYKKKQAVVNEEILRRRELEEKQDFYRVLLGSQEIDDIQCLLSIREKLIYRENLDKLIYDVYISKQVAEMIKRVLKGAAPSGIYKITRLKTGEIYIGKSTDVKKRWSEHCKTAYGVGTIAHSVLHTTIKKDGIENFTFELLEEVPKDKLTEREKYWIAFYDSKNYGLNERNG